MYRCLVQSAVIDTPGKAIIDSVSGKHLVGRSNDVEICFHIDQKEVYYFPSGLEKIYKNLAGICFFYGPLKEIHQSDLKPYTKLIFLQIAETQIEILEDGLFDFNPNLEYIALSGNKIFHIGVNVFDSLSKLGTLYLDRNSCINMQVKNDRSFVLDIIKATKNQCMSSDFTNLNEELKNLDNESKSLNWDTFLIFKTKRENLESKIKESKFAEFPPIKAGIEKLMSLKIQDYPQVCSKFSQIDLTC